MGVTAHGLVYPEPGDSVDVVRDIKALANSVDPWAPALHRPVLVGSGTVFASASFPAGTTYASLLGPFPINLSTPAHVRFDFWFGMRAPSTFGVTVGLLLDSIFPAGSSTRKVNSYGGTTVVDCSFSWEGDLAATAHTWALVVTVDAGSGAVTTGGLGTYQINATS